MCGRWDIDVKRRVDSSRPNTVWPPTVAAASHGAYAGIRARSRIHCSAEYSNPSVCGETREGHASLRIRVDELEYLPVKTFLRQLGTLSTFRRNIQPFELKMRILTVRMTDTVETGVYVCMHLNTSSLM